MTRKKIVLIIVEGSSDDEALGVLLDQIYDKNTVHVHITHGDVTTARGTNPSNILSKLGTIFREYRISRHLTTKHFQEIVHIVDMDGAFIPDDAVIEDVTAAKPFYSLKEIRTANVQGIIFRNTIKQGCINKISATKSINGIPYQVYFMYCMTS